MEKVFYDTVPFRSFWKCSYLLGRPHSAAGNPSVPISVPADIPGQVPP